ncbi:MAG: biotin carboxylase, partial [Chloroflexota bacterium]|nr:biotin carboxylase [Chloroflexota bacterium]
APKPGGYRDSGADIAFALRQAGVTVVTPEQWPDPAVDDGWTFPDTAVGIAAAVQAGATTLWANTVLFSGHPLEQILGRVRIVGQIPAVVDRYDDKAVMNQELADAGVPVVRHVLLAESPTSRSKLSLDALDAACLAHEGLTFPLVVKPIRGRGSAGVTVVDSLTTLRTTVAATIASGHFGSTLMVEPYLPGDEVTITVMPPDRFRTSAPARHWCLPPVRRVNHHDGVAPYNGTVAVVHNSEVLSAAEQADPTVLELLDACRTVAEYIDARAPIRIDCRQDTDGVFRVFDVNLKPNMTGPGRPGRDDQLSLTGMAAAAVGMSYTDLLTTMLAAAWA